MLTKVNYDIVVYLEFTFYHLIYFVFFGIVLVIIVLPFRKARILMKNLQFIPDAHYFFILQVIFWINSILTLLAMFYFGGSNPITNVVMLVTNQLSLITRASNIAAKYATFPPALLKRYREQVLDRQEFRSQLLLAFWAQQTPEVVESEYLNAMHRNGFDLSIFRFSFLDKPNDTVEADLDWLEKEQHLDSAARNVVNLGDNKTRTYYHGGGVFMAVIRKFNATKSRRALRLWVQVLAIIWGLTPLLVKIGLGRSIINKENIFDTVAFYLGLLVSWFLFSFTNLFYAQAKYDIQRTIYIMAQLSHLISTQKKTTEEYKVLPTMNFMEEYSLNSWKIMRRIALDYGKQYFYRHEIYLPVVFLLVLVSAFGALCLQIVQTYLPNITEGMDVVEIQLNLMVCAVLFMTVFLDLLMGFAEINQFFEVHIMKLYKIKNLVADLKKYQDHYFRKYYAVQCPIKLGQGCMSKIFRHESESHVHRRLAKEIADTIGAEKLEAQVRGFLQDCSESVESIIAEVTVDQSFHSITILGFVISKSFTFNLLMVLLSVGGTAYQMFVPNGPISN